VLHSLRTRTTLSVPLHLPRFYIPYNNINTKVINLENGKIVKEGKSQVKKHQATNDEINEMVKILMKHPKRSHGNEIISYIAENDIYLVDDNFDNIHKILQTALNNKI
jgi:predicted small metal-binding protein